MKKPYKSYAPKKPYYDPCPHCGASLDPGERCERKAARAERATPPKPRAMAAAAGQ